MMDSMDKKDIIAGAVYTPVETSAYTVEHIKKIKENEQRAMPFFIPRINEYFAPTMAGQVTAVIAQTSQYKSGLMRAWEREFAKLLVDNKRTNEIIIHVSVEECAEEQGIVELAVESGESSGALARGQVQDWSKLSRASVAIGSIPIYRIGDSLARADDMPNLYLTNIIKSIAFLRDEMLSWRPKISAIFVDYLQALPIDPEIRQASHDQQRRLQVRNDVYRLREMSAKFDCPVVVGVQAKQNLNADIKNWRMPDVYDGEESSSIAQRADRVICLWLPKMTHPVGSHIDYNGLAFDVTDNLLFIKVAKQRGNLPSGKTWRCWVNYDANSISLETL
jgi:replicative DNA helicase